MNFQKTLLATSLAFAAVSAQAAVWVDPAQNNSDLSNSAPVTGSGNLSEIAVDGDVLGKEIDLGSGATNPGTAGAGITYRIDKYKTQSGTDVIRLTELGTDKVLGTYVDPKDKNNATLEAYNGNDIIFSSLSEGGQLTTQGGSSTGYESKIINSEHVIYGYQGISGNTTLKGDYTDADGKNLPFVGTITGSGAASTKYVQTGILGNTGPRDAAGKPTDASQNIYGVSAKNGNNITVLTGDGIALGDLSNGGQLNSDGSVSTKPTLVDQTGQTKNLKSSQYVVGGTTYYVTYNDDAGNVVAPKYYTVDANGDLSLTDAEKAKAAIGTTLPTRSGVANETSGTYETAKTKNTVTNKNVTYSEQTVRATATATQIGVTNADGSVGKTLTNSTTPVVIESQQQSVSTGVLGKDAKGQNIYGLEVSKSTEKDGKITAYESTSVKSSGVVTTGDVAIDGTNISLRNLDARANDLNNRLDDVKKTAYRGVAIALATQQQVPNVKPGQYAVFGGIGQYESETAGALGVVGAINDRTSVSAAVGFAGGSEVGGRVGVSYLFGGN